MLVTTISSSCSFHLPHSLTLSRSDETRANDVAVVCASNATAYAAVGLLRAETCKKSWKRIGERARGIVCRRQGEKIVFHVATDNDAHLRIAFYFDFFSFRFVGVAVVVVASFDVCAVHISTHGVSQTMRSARTI